MSDPEDLPPGALAAARLGLAVEVRDVGPSDSMAAHEAKLGVPPGSLCKTLVVRRGEDDYVLLVIPGGRRMEWPLVREALGVSRASMATREQALAATGYAPGSITPLGASTAAGATWPVVVDESARAHQRLAIGSGRPGVSLLVSTGALIDRLGARVEPVSVPDGP